MAPAATYTAKRGTNRVTSYRPYYFEVRGELLLLSPLHIGTGESWHAGADAPLLRESGDPAKPPLIPATSLKGILRAFLRRTGSPPELIKVLFGFAGDRIIAGNTGRVRLFDAASLSTVNTETRDHVRIHPQTGAVDGRGKFDEEVAAAGTLFSFRAIYEGENAEEPAAQAWFQALTAAAHQEIRVGAKAGRGYGRFTLQNLRTFQAQRSDPAGLDKFTKYRLHPKEDPTHWDPFVLAPPVSRRGVRLECELLLHFEGPMLIQTAAASWEIGETSADKPETYWIQGRRTSERGFFESTCTSGTAPALSPTLPGSSLRGVLRAQCRRIADYGGRPELTELVFGSANHTQRNSGQKGRISLSDGTLDSPPRWVFLDHVAIDRITGFAAHGKKFSSSALDAPVFKITISLDRLDEDIRPLALLGHLLRDMSDGKLAVGSGTSRGYGKLATIAIRDIRVTVDGDPNPTVSIAQPAAQQRWEELWLAASQAWSETKPCSASKEGGTPV